MVRLPGLRFPENSGEKNLRLRSSIDTDLKARLDGAVLDVARPVAVGLALLHVVLSFGHVSMLNSDIRAAAIAINTSVAATLVATGIILGKWRPPLRFAPVMATFIAATALTAAVTMLAVTREPEYTTNMSLLAIGSGLFLLSTGWLIAFFAVALTAFLIIAGTSPESAHWLFFFFNLIGSMAIGLGAHVVRLRTTIRAERARRDAEQRARELGSSEERYALSIAGANDGLYDWNLETGEAYFSARFKAILGFREEELANDPGEITRRIHPDDVERVRSQIVDHLRNLTPHFEDEYRVLRKDGTYGWVLTRGVTVRNASGRAIRMAGSMTDMTGRGVFDPLTALPNRMLLLDRLRRVFSRGSRRGNKFAVLFLDLDRFKIINDSLGHHTGDEVLIQVARRLQAAVREVDTVARLGGDEFVIILEDIDERDLAASIARVEEQVSGHYHVADREVFITASIGAVVDTDAYESAEDILRDADTAMYQAKQSDHSHVVFDVRMREAVRRRLQIEGDLRRAVSGEEFVLAFQPIVSLGNGYIHAVEALARWEHPERGNVEPAEFIPVMDEIGIMTPFSTWSLVEACLQLIAWDSIRSGGRPSVSVNLSGRQLTRDDIVADVASVLDRTGLEPSRLILEVTEDAVMDRADTAARTLRRLKALGVHITLDDFGTGQSSLGALHSLPIDSLKIDRSFVRRIPAEQQAIELIRTMIVLGHNLGVQIVAEGIETVEQLAILHGMECDLGQGNLFGAPGPLGRFGSERLAPTTTRAAGA